MKYRRYGKDGPEVSVLGFGVMRLPPRKKGDWGSVNFSKSVRVMRTAMEAGVNFFDSHHRYHNGLSEEAIGRALKGWKGQKIYIQTKTPMYNEKPMKYFKGLIEQALEKTGVDTIDYLLFHGMTMPTFKKRGKAFFKLTDWAMKKNYIRYRGFSSHDSPENIKKFVATGEFSAMLVSFNYLNPRVRDAIEYAADRGMGVSVMNPLAGGTLAETTIQIKRLITGAKSAPEIGLRYVLSTPGVTCALSGMNTVEQVEENTAIAERKVYMTEKQRSEMNKRLNKLKKPAKICSLCAYCMPCPAGVNIPGNFLYYNCATLFGVTDTLKEKYQGLKKLQNGDASAAACKKCRKCIPKCPNKIPIVEELEKAEQLLG